MNTAPPNTVSGRNEHLRILDYVPQSVFQSWFNDEYFIGTGSRAAYYDLGTMLMLRGMYRYMMYPNEPAKGEESKVSHGGCCYVDIEQDELVLSGVRLYTSAEYPDAHLFYLRPWRSVAVKIVHPRDLSSLDRDLVLLIQLSVPSTPIEQELKKCVNAELAESRNWAPFFPPVQSLDTCHSQQAEAQRVNREAKTPHFVRILQKLSDFALQLDEEHHRNEQLLMPNQASRLRVQIASIDAGRSNVSISGAYGTIGMNETAARAGLTSGRVRFERIKPEGGLE
jgi:hypothetical protein